MNKLKNNKGSVAVVVIVAVLFIMSVSLTLYFAAVNRKNESLKQTEMIKAAYEKDVDKMDELYATYEEQSLYIYTKQDLENFRDRVNSGVSFAGKTVYLMNDIDLNPGKYTVANDGTITFDSTAEQWIPIGTSTYNFDGTFEGNEHVISGLYITETTSNNQGMFKKLNGVVKNITLDKGVIISTLEATGVLVGTNNGTVENIKNYNVIKSYSAVVGGIVGWNSGTVTECNNMANISRIDNSNNYNSEARIGGIIGQNLGIVKRCVNAGDILGEGNHTGGIVGFNQNENTSISSIEKCYNKGRITGYYVGGGIVGENYIGRIDACYNNGDITSNNNSHAGGISGETRFTSVLSNLYNIGKITSNSQGGIVAIALNDVTINNCYYLEGTATDIIRRVYSPTITNSSSQTDSFMKSQAFVELLGTSNWMIKAGENNGYPVLR